MSVVDTIKDVVNTMCSKHCKFPEQYFSQHKDVDTACKLLTEEKCKDCPLNKLL